MKLADLSNPVALAKIIAASNANTIPVNATGTSYASQTEGFPAITMIPEGQGGEAPHGLDFNGFLKMLSSHVFNIQNGTPETFNPAVSTAIGGYPKNAQLWLIDDNNSRYLKSTKDDNTDNFLTNPSVIGTSWVDAFPTKDYVDNGLATKQNTIIGAASTVTKNNLTASRALVSNGSGKVAVSAVTATELGYLDGVTSAIQTQLNAKAADSAVVKLTDTQTIGGTKTFQADPYIKNAAAQLYMDDTQQTKGTAPSADVWSAVTFHDANGNLMGRCRQIYAADKSNKVELQVHKANSSSDTDSSTMGIKYPASGSAYGFAPNSDVNGSILTTVSKTKAQNGQFTLGNGLLIQWGYTSSVSGNTTIELPTSFSGTDYSVAFGLNVSGSSYAPNIVSKTSATFVYQCIENRKSFWIAIGHKS